jgi:hypothetical protein
VVSKPTKHTNSLDNDEPPHDPASRLADALQPQSVDDALAFHARQQVAERPRSLAIGRLQRGPEVDVHGRVLDKMTSSEPERATDARSIRQHCAIVAVSWSAPGTGWDLYSTFDLIDAAVLLA